MTKKGGHVPPIEPLLEKLEECIGLFWEEGQNAESVENLDWNLLSLASVIVGGLRYRLQIEEEESKTKA